MEKTLSIADLSSVYIYISTPLLQYWRNYAKWCGDNLTGLKRRMDMYREAHQYGKRFVYPKPTRGNAILHKVLLNKGYKSKTDQYICL